MSITTDVIFVLITHREYHGLDNKVINLEKTPKTKIASFQI